MRRQRNMDEMKGKIKIPEKELNKVEISICQMQSSQHCL